MAEDGVDSIQAKALSKENNPYQLSTKNFAPYEGGREMPKGPDKIPEGIEGDARGYIVRKTSNIK
jgi:hypothetical protein